MLLCCSERESLAFSSDYGIPLALYDESYTWDMRFAISTSPLQRTLVMRNRATGYILLLDMRDVWLYLPQKGHLAFMEEALIGAGFRHSDVGFYLRKGKDFVLDFDKTPPYAKRKLAEVVKWVEEVGFAKASKDIADRPVILNHRRVDARALLATHLEQRKPEIVKEMHAAIIVYVELLLFPKKKVWRRFLVSMDASFGDLHYIIQEGFGWNGRHLHEFHVGLFKHIRPKRWIEESPQEGDTVELIDEEQVFVGQLSQRAEYWLGVGNGLIHSIEVQQFVLVEEEPAPLCIDGGGDISWEGIGGLFEDVEHSDGEMTPDWREAARDVYHFDKSRINSGLSDLFYGVQPTTWI
jgi:hypothetical protein